MIQKTFMATRKYLLILFSHLRIHRPLSFRKGTSNSPSWSKIFTSPWILALNDIPRPLPAMAALYSSTDLTILTFDILKSLKLVQIIFVYKTKVNGPTTRIRLNTSRLFIFMTMSNIKMTFYKRSISKTDQTMYSGRFQHLKSLIRDE